MISIALRAAMLAIWPLRFLGIFGTVKSPRIYTAGETVPSWLYVRYPSRVRMTFIRRSAVFFVYRDGEMHIQPIDGQARGAVVRVDGGGGDVVLVGAPTTIHTRGCNDESPPRRSGEGWWARPYCRRSQRQPVITGLASAIHWR